MNTLYTLGYAGRTLDEIADIAKARGAGVVDIRFSSWSREPKWRGGDLKRSLEYRGVNYIHVPALGNANYNKPAPIEIANEPAGCRELSALLKRNPQIILCACKDVQRCHRKAVAAIMEQRYFAPVVHLDAKSPQPEINTPRPSQEELF